jgi:DNA-binding transcriptional ArsR family regulator
MAGKLKGDAMFASIVAHPIRCHALIVMASRESSPTQLSQELHVDPSHVAYHVKVLREAGLILKTEEIPKRGSVEHIYRGLYMGELTDAEYAELTSDERAAYAYFTACVAVAEASYAASTGSFALDHRINRMPLTVDDEGWGEVSELLDRTSEGLERIRQAAQTRLADSGAVGKPLLALTTMFEVPADSARGIVGKARSDLKEREEEDARREE